MGHEALNPQCKLATYPGLHKGTNPYKNKSTCTHNHAGKKCSARQDLKIGMWELGGREKAYDVKGHMGSQDS